jgi:hypothetical protein
MHVQAAVVIDQPIFLNRFIKKLTLGQSAAAGKSKANRHLFVADCTRSAPGPLFKTAQKR